MKNATILTCLLAMAAAGAGAQEGHPTVEPGKAGAVVGGSAKVRAAIAFAPVLHIQLGSGATSKNGEADIVNIEAKTAKDYEKGISRTVGKQLEVFSVGTAYSVDAEVDAPKSLYSIFALHLKDPGTPLPPMSEVNNAWRNMTHLYTGEPDGKRELDAFYRLRMIYDGNLWAFNDLLGKDGEPKKYSVNITYAIVPL